MQFYKAVTAPAAWGDGDDVGFVPRSYKLSLRAGGPVEYSFGRDPITKHGVLGPSGTSPMVIEHQTGSSRIWFKGAAEVIDVWAWD